MARRGNANPDALPHLVVVVVKADGVCINNTPPVPYDQVLEALAALPPEFGLAQHLLVRPLDNADLRAK